MGYRFKKAELGVFNTTNSDSAISGFKKDCRLLGLTRGQFSLIDLIRSVLKKTGKAHVITTTWSAGIKDVHQVDWLKTNDLIYSFKLITDHSYATRQKKYAMSIVDLFGAENIRTSEIHAKFTLIHNENYNVCIRTSMNLNANKTCENFEIDEDKDVFDFYMNFIEHTFGDMPNGFTTSSFKVNKSLDKFFNTNCKQLAGWSEI
jgi:hypothetical protein